MVRRWSWIWLLLAASLASAEPLPDGTQVVLDNSQLWFIDHGTKVPLFDANSSFAERTYDRLVNAQLSHSGSCVAVTAVSCMDPSVNDPLIVVIGLAHLQARAENVRGMQLQLKKQYRDAIPHFAAAATLDPDSAVYATNLLSAQSLGNLLDDADHTLSTLGPRNVPWFAWRLAVDHDLASLRGRASAKPFTAAKPTKLVSGAFDKGVAVSPEGYVAYAERGRSTDVIVVYDVKRDQELVRIEDRKVALVVLDSLGFVAQPLTWVELDENAHTIVSPDKKVEVTETNDTITIARGGAKTTIGLGLGWGARVGFGPSVALIVHRVMHACGGAENSWIVPTVVALP